MPLTELVMEVGAAAGPGLPGVCWGLDHEQWSVQDPKEWAQLGSAVPVPRRGLGLSAPGLRDVELRLPPLLCLCWVWWVLCWE